MAMAEIPDCVQEYTPLAIEASIPSSPLIPQVTPDELCAVGFASVSSSLPFRLDGAATESANHGVEALIGAHSSLNAGHAALA